MLVSSLFNNLSINKVPQWNRITRSITCEHSTNTRTPGNITTLNQWPISQVRFVHWKHSLRIDLWAPRFHLLLLRIPMAIRWMREARKKKEKKIPFITDPPPVPLTSTPPPTLLPNFIRNWSYSRTYVATSSLHICFEGMETSPKGPVRLDQSVILNLCYMPGDTPIRTSTNTQRLLILLWHMTIRMDKGGRVICRLIWWHSSTDQIIICFPII